MDIVTAFLHRCLDEIIYIEQSYPFELNPELVCRLCKALYELKQAPQVWYKTLANFLTKLGLEGLKLDNGVFVSRDQMVFLEIYLDDLLVFASDKSCLTDIQDQPSAPFKITNLGEVSHHLDIKVDVEVEKQISL